MINSKFERRLAMAINIITIKNYLRPIILREYYSQISFPKNGLPWPDANLYLESITKGKTSYLYYTVEIVSNTQFNYLYLLLPAEQILNKYLAKPKHFKNTNTKLQTNLHSSLYSKKFTIKLTKTEALNLYTLFKLTNKG